jgi:hypothetical protein
MANYFILDAQADRTHLRIAESRIPERYTNAVLDGESIKPARSAPVAYIEKKTAKAVDFVGGVVTVPIVSAKMQGTLERVAEACEFYPVRLTLRRDARVEFRYLIFSALGLVDAFDWERSKYRRLADSPAVSRVEKLVLDESKVGNRNVFRLSAFPTQLIVSGKARAELESAQLLGLQFIPTSEYRPAI